jgi:hypothetical protein
VHFAGCTSYKCRGSSNVGRIADSGHTSRQRPQELQGGDSILTFIAERYYLVIPAKAGIQSQLRIAGPGSPLPRG